MPAAQKPKMVRLHIANPAMRGALSIETRRIDPRDGAHIDSVSVGLLQPGQETDIDFNAENQAIVIAASKDE